ncbi:hypothetical protein IMZ48_27305 [Candidatus Bathyarchaeota archaeon]|nr:hypothetical protein [Candidatus Bathyarchaeota archaeon]
MSDDPSPRIPQGPPVFTEVPDSVLTNASRLIENARDVQRRIVESVTPETASFSNVLLPLARSENVTRAEKLVIGFYRFASADPELRKASKDAQNLFDEFAIETATNEDVFKLVKAVVERGEELDPESARLLQKSYKAR